MKKIISLLLALTLMAGLFAACNNEPEVDEPENEVVLTPTDDDIQAPVDDDKPVDEDKKEEVDEPENKPVADPPATKPSTAPTTKPATKPSTAPTTKPETKPEAKPQPKPETKPEGETTPPQEPAKKEYSIRDVHNIIKNTYGEDYRPNVEVPKEALTDFYGLNVDDIEDFIAEQPMISANIDTFIAIKAKDGKGESVAAALSSYKENLVNGMMYPSNMPKAQAAQVVRHGDYVFLVMLGAASELDADEETQNKFAKEQVAKGVSAINAYFAK